MFVNYYEPNNEKNPTLVLDRLIRTKDESKFISKGVISRTITKIAKQFPKEIIPRLINHLGSDDKDIKLNVIASLDGLIEDYMDKIDIKSIISLIRSENDKKIKKEASQLILKISKINPLALQPVMTDLLQSITEQDLSIRIILTKSMLEISKQLPDLIPVRLTINLLSDEDSFIRETSVKILGYIGQKLSFATAEALMYISLYPLIDFLFIALSSESDEGLTPFHKFIGNKIIHLSKSKIISVIMAILLYLLFIIPPLLLSLAGLPFLVIWVSC
ncbi:unnamed protein product, partial [marine sediment metagenome]